MRRVLTAVLPSLLAASLVWDSSDQHASVTTKALIYHASVLQNPWVCNNVDMHRSHTVPRGEEFSPLWWEGAAEHLGATEQSRSNCGKKLAPQHEHHYMHNQVAEKQKFLEFTASYGITQDELLPGDILINKDYGDSYAKLYDALTSVTEVLLALRHPRRAWHRE